MARQEKEALLALGASLAFATLMLFLRAFRPGFGCDGVLVALLGFILLVWCARRAVGMRARALDERDLAIRYQAGLVASHVLGATAMVGAAILCALHRTTQAAPTVQVMLLAYYGWLAMYIVWSVTVLVLYRRGL